MGKTPRHALKLVDKRISVSSISNFDRLPLGQTGIVIPRIFLGTGTGDRRGDCIQAKIAPEDFAPLLKEAYRHGLNFWDTSDDYGTHPHVRLAMKGIPREQLIIATKTYAITADEARKSVSNSLNELGTDYADILHIHSVDSLALFQKKLEGALRGLLQEKKEGRIRAIGFSTHTIAVLEKAVEIPELDVIMTNFNKYEVHMDASLEWYTRCLERAHQNGKGVLVMKTIGEGRLHDRAAESIDYNLSRPFIHSVCVGITCRRDLEEVIEVQNRNKKTLIS